MKLALIVAVALVGVAVASPAKRTSASPIFKNEGRNEIVLNSVSRRQTLLGDRVRPSSLRVQGSEGHGSPVVYFRSPRYFQQEYYERSPPGSWVPSRGKNYNYKIVKSTPKWVKRSRDSDEEDDDVTAEDDDDEDEEDEEEQNELETPTWDELFPPSEQGDYGQAQKNPSYVVGQRRRNVQVVLAGDVPQDHNEPTGEVVVPAGPAGRGRHAMYEDALPQQRRVKPVTLRVISPRQYNFDVGAPRRQNYYVGSGNRRASWNPFSQGYSQGQGYSKHGQGYPQQGHGYSQQGQGYSQQGQRYSQTPEYSQNQQYSQNQENSDESRRPWGPASGPVFHFQEGKTSNSQYPYMPASGYQGRSNTYQGRRNNRIPVFYSQRGYY